LLTGQVEQDGGDEQEKQVEGHAMQDVLELLAGLA